MLSQGDDDKGKSAEKSPRKAAWVRLPAPLSRVIERDKNVVSAVPQIDPHPGVGGGQKLPAAGKDPLFQQFGGVGVVGDGETPGTGGRAVIAVGKQIFQQGPAAIPAPSEPSGESPALARA